MDFKDNYRAKVTISNMKKLLEEIEESMDSFDDTSHLVKKVANQANELLKMTK
ncbi:hypothetical protein [Bacillus sp. M6-12]|uniref:hypothetical protein n=1 Tax=Bacillus sp. M6-12 TaxID=2054166 RepID=UPI0015E0A873|nr:hypothetical protein [Bacillus sp. M6-12]